MDIDGKTSSRHPPWRKFPLENAPNHSPEAGNVSCHEKASQPSGIFFSLKKNSCLIPQNVSTSSMQNPPLSLGESQILLDSFWVLNALDPPWKTGKEFHFYFGITELFQKRGSGTIQSKCQLTEPCPQVDPRFPGIQDF